ncbi:unnamed protein product [Brassicogethes aeneus]|uniref:Uncharacterized protein n=1 Tax=Brassicogethes aeneus TaxID=1431903 RepID=A0A9P0FDA4_BRAAE|nr:unnamed protein product [Brassicogethes aeneus]
MFASASESLSYHKWCNNDLENYFIFTEENKGKYVNFSWSHDNTYIAVVQENEKPIILSSRDKTNMHHVHTVQVLDNVTNLAFKNHTKKIIAFGNSHGDVCIYNTKKRDVETKIPNLKTPINSLEYSVDDQQLAILNDQKLILYNTENYNQDLSQLFHKSLCTTMKFHPIMPNQCAVGCLNGNVVFWDIYTSVKLRHYQKHSNKVTGVAMTSCGKQLLSGGLDYKICLIDNLMGDCVFRMNLHQPVTTMDLSPDDKLIAIGTEDGSVYLYDMRNYLQPIYRRKVHNTAVNKIKFEHGFVGNHEVLNFRKSSISMGSEKEAELLAIPKIPPPTVQKNEIFEQIKRDLMKSLKLQMDDLEGQLIQHCSKFQNFLDNEFDSLHESLKCKWDIFSGDGAQLMQALNCGDTNKSCTTLNKKK